MSASEMRIFCWTAYFEVLRYCRHFIGLIAPVEILIRSSLYQRIYPVQEAHKIFQRCACPVSAVVHFIFEPPEKDFARSVIRWETFARHGPYKSLRIDTFKPAWPPIMTLFDALLSVNALSGCCWPTCFDYLVMYKIHVRGRIKSTNSLVKCIIDISYQIRVYFI